MGRGQRTAHRLWTSVSDVCARMYVCYAFKLLRAPKCFAHVP